MCGRYTYSTTLWQKVWTDLLGSGQGPALEATWNIAPTRMVPVIRANPETGKPEPLLMRWGLIPSWAKDPGIGSRMINARGETVAEKPAFRAAFRRRRCLMLSTGFYEWRDPGTAQKQPFFITLKDDKPFALAGIWEHWKSPEGQEITSCAIVTVEANAEMAVVHHRQPVILTPETAPLWLDPARTDPKDIFPLVKACPSEWLVIRQVSKAVNNPRNDDPRLIRGED